MFDLRELDQAELALRALTSGTHQRCARAAEPAVPSPQGAPRPQGDIAKCQFHNGTLQRAGEFTA
jgi:hypothetical protein